MKNSNPLQKYYNNKPINHNIRTIDSVIIKTPEQIAQERKIQADKKLRKMVRDEIEKRLNNGTETLEDIAYDIANKESIQKHFSYLVIVKDREGNIVNALKDIFVNWYNSYLKTKEIEGRGEF